MHPKGAFREFSDFNKAPVAKNWWCLLKAPNSMLGRIFSAVYYPDGKILNAEIGYRPSYAWTSIFKSRIEFKRGGRWKVGNGALIDIWHDKWIPHGSLLLYKPTMMFNQNIILVKDLFLQDQIEWDALKVTYLFPPAIAHQILSIPLSNAGNVDTFFWPHATDGEYSCKTGYAFLKQVQVLGTTTTSRAVSPLSPAAWKKLWRADALPRCKEVAWRCCHGILPLRPQLSIRGMDIAPLSPLCHEDNETTLH